MQHILNYELNLGFRRQVAVTIETATTIEPHLAENIKTWPAKYERLQLKQKTTSKLKPSLP